MEETEQEQGFGRFAMKRFLLTLAAFGIILSVVLVLADSLLSRNMRGVNTYGMETWKDILEGQAGAEVLVLGDSRALNSCDREVLDSIIRHPAYNLAIVGNPFVVQEFRYRMYREHNPKPRVILHFVDDFFLSPNFSLDDPLQFLPWMWNGSFRRGFLAFGIPVFFREAFPFFRYQGTRPWAVERHQRQSTDGFFAFEDEVFHFSALNKRGFRYQEETDAAFRTYLQTAREEGVRVVLVLPTIYESVGFQDGDEEKMLGYYTSVADAYGLPFFDGSALEIKHDSTLFLDPGHLNAKGARVFSDTLARYLSGLGLFED